MKRFILVLMLVSSFAHGAAYDVAVEQRNATNNGWVTRLMASSPTNGLLMYNASTLLPQWVTPAGGLVLNGTNLTGVEQANWLSASGTSQILNKPTLAAVATSGAYSDLSGRPTIPAAQVQSDWNATLAPAAILNKPALFSGAYGDLTGIPLTFAPTVHTHAAGDIVSGTIALARLPAFPISQTIGLQTALDGKFAAPTGSSSQYLRGDGSVATFPTFPAAQVNTDWNASSGVSQLLNKPTLSTVATSGAYADLSGKPSIPAAQVNSDWNAVSGVAQILNKPALTSGTVTSVTAGTGLSGGVITTSGTISLPNAGTAGTYSAVTTDAQGRVTAGTNASQSAATRALNTAFQVSATRDSWVSYSVQITVTASISGGQNGDVILEIASNSGFTANVQTLAVAGVGQTYTLAIALQGVQPQTNVVSGFIPAGYYARLRTVNNTGTPAFSYRAGQEALF